MGRDTNSLKSRLVAGIGSGVSVWRNVSEGQWQWVQKTGLGDRGGNESWLGLVRVYATDDGYPLPGRKHGLQGCAPI